MERFQRCIAWSLAAFAYIALYGWARSLAPALATYRENSLYENGCMLVVLVAAIVVWHLVMLERPQGLALQLLIGCAALGIELILLETIRYGLAGRVSELALALISLYGLLVCIFASWRFAQRFGAPEDHPA